MSMAGEPHDPESSADSERFPGRVWQCCGKATWYFSKSRSDFRRTKSTIGTFMTSCVSIEGWRIQQEADLPG